MPVCRKQIDNLSKMTAPLSQKLPAIKDAVLFSVFPAIFMFCCSIHIKLGVFSKLLPSFGESDVSLFRSQSLALGPFKYMNWWLLPIVSQKVT